jgi:hypothetical protein
VEDQVGKLSQEIAQLRREEARLRKGLVAISTGAKKARQFLQDATVLLAPLRRLLVTLEADPQPADFVEARRLVAAATSILNDALDGIPPL